MKPANPQPDNSEPAVNNRSQHVARVFISYSHNDIEVAEAVEKRLRGEGYDVYRDATRIRHMTHWTKELAKELSQRDVVVLLWSDAAAQSEWVRSEWMTARALEQGIIVCLLDPAERLRPESALPADLGEYHYILLVRGEGAGLDRGIGEIIRLLREPERIPRKWTYTAPPKNFFVPFPVNPNFVGRKDLMLDLYLLFLGNLGPVGINQTAVAFGMGGIGKTQLAAEFCWRYSFAFPGGVLWINAARGLITEFCQAAYRLGLSVDRPDSPDATQRLLALLDGHISRNQKMLLVLDNLPDPADVNREVVPGFRPSALNCSLLVTTRRQDLPRGMNPVRVDVLPLHDAMALLTRDFPPRDESEQASARVICKRLGGLPLAIEMAASFIADQQGVVSYARYLEHLKNRIAVIDSTGGARPLATHDSALLVVLQQQHDAITNPDARLLFLIAGQMEEAELIPRRRLELLSGSDDSGPGLVPRFSAALNELATHTLVEKLEGARIRLHPLVWEFARSLMSDKEASCLRSTCAMNGLACLASSSLIERAYELNGHDVYALIRDVDIAVAWAPSGNIHARLRELRRLLDRESRNLRKEEIGKGKSFRQQLLYRATRMGLTEIVADAGEPPACLLVPLTKPIREDSTPVRYLARHVNTITSLALSPNDRKLVSGSLDRRVILWDLFTGEPLQEYGSNSERIMAVALSPDESQILCGSMDGEISLWDVASRRPVFSQKRHGLSVYTVAFSPDGRRFLSGSWDRNLILWDRATCLPLQTMWGHPNGIFSAAFFPDGNRAVSGSWDGTLIVWDLATGRPKQSMLGHDGLKTVACSSDGVHLLSGHWDGTFVLWDCESGRQVWVNRGHRHPIYAGAFLPEGNVIATGSDDGTLVLWNTDTKESVLSLRGHKTGVRAAAVSRNSGYMTSGAEDGSIALWDISSAKPTDVRLEHSQAIYGVALSLDAKLAVSASADQTLIVRDAITGRALRRLSGHTAEVSSVALAPDGANALSGSWDGKLILWDVRTGKKMRILEKHRGEVCGVAISPDGRMGLSGSVDQNLVLWDLSTGRAIRVFSGHTDVVFAVSFTPDGRQALSGSRDGTLRSWRLDSGQVERVLRGHTAAITALAFSPDGSKILSASSDRSLILWDRSRGVVLRRFAGHESDALAVRFALEGRYAVSSSSDDESLFLWDVGREEPLLKLGLASGSQCLDVANNILAVGLDSAIVEFFRIRPPRSNPAGPPSLEKDAI